MSGPAHKVFYDTHAHFDAWEAGGLTGEVLARAAAAGVARVLAVGGSVASNAAAVAAALRFPGTVGPAIGHDRDRAGELAASDEALTAAVAALRDDLARRTALSTGVAAIGEIGLDFHYHPESQEQQKRLFEAQLDLARKLRLPVIVHSREAEEATLVLLRAHAAAWTGDPSRIGVLHCFTGETPFALAIAEGGFHVSFSGIATFRNAGPIREAARAVPEDRLLIETDSPYLAPVPLRGRPNEPAYLVHVAEVVAAARGIPIERLAEITTRNAERLFGDRGALPPRSPV